MVRARELAEATVTTPARRLVVLLSVIAAPVALRLVVPSTARATPLAWLIVPLAEVVRLRVPSMSVALATVMAPAALTLAEPVTSAPKLRARLLASVREAASTCRVPVKALPVLLRFTTWPAASRLVLPVTVKAAVWAKAPALVMERLPPTLVAPEMVAAVTPEPLARACRVASPLIVPLRLRTEALVS